MGASSSQPSPIDDLIARLAGKDSIDLHDPFWSLLLSHAVLSCQDPAYISERLIRPGLLQNNSQSQNVQSLTMHAISLLRDAKETRKARYQAANALHILRTLIVLSEGNLSTLFDVPLGSSHSSASTHPKGHSTHPRGHKLLSVLIQQVIQVIITIPPSDTSYCLLHEAVLFLIVSQAPTLYSPSGGLNPSLDALLGLGKDSSALLVERLLEFITSQPKPHSSERPFRTHPSNHNDRDEESVPSSIDDDDILASATGLFWMPFDTSDPTRPPKSLFRTPRSSVETIPLGPGEALGGSVDLGGLSLHLLVLVLNLPNEPPSMINCYKEAIAALVDESTPIPLSPSAPIHDPTSSERSSWASGREGGADHRASNPGGPPNLSNLGSFSSFLGSSWSVTSNKPLPQAPPSSSLLTSTPLSPTPQPRVCFTTLLSSLISRGPCDETGTLLLYSLLSTNFEFKRHASSLGRRPGPALLILHLTRCLHLCPKGASSYSFVLQALFLILSEDVSLAPSLGLHSLDASQVTFYAEALEAPIDLSSLVILVLLQTISSRFSLPTDPHQQVHSRGSLLPTNALAALSNLAPHVTNLHPRAAHRLVSSLQSLTRMRAKVTAELLKQGGDQGTLPGTVGGTVSSSTASGTVSSLLSNLAVISDYTQSVLLTLVAMTRDPSRNPLLVYSLVARQHDLLIPLLNSKELLIPLLNSNDGSRSQPLLGGVNGTIVELVSPLLDMTQFFERQVRGASYGGASVVVREEGEALKLIASASAHYHPVQRGRGSMRKESRWVYMEDGQANIFFLPYIWTLSLQIIPAVWPTKTFPLLVKK